MVSQRITVDGLLALFAGLALGACEKSAPEVAPEKAQTQAVRAAPAASQAVQAKEVTPAAPSASAAAGSCAPGGCAPGACGANKK